MASQQSTADHVLEQLERLGATAKRMFGEFGIFCDGRMVAVICDDQLFLRDTKAGRALLGNPETAPPYPGAKPWIVIGADVFDEPERLAELVTATIPEVPLARQRAKKRGAKAPKISARLAK
jgi:TfoX/Sxy family transcriptional regulator of competence genes